MKTPQLPKSLGITTDPSFPNSNLYNQEHMQNLILGDMIRVSEWGRGEERSQG